MKLLFSLRISASITFAIGALVLAVPHAYAFEFGTPIDASEWLVVASPFECTLIHPINGYGAGEFVHTAGEDPKLRLSGRGYRFAKQNVNVSAESPKWRPGRPGRSIVEIGPEAGKVMISESHANEILSELDKGMQIGFRGVLAGSKQQNFNVYLSSVGFQAAYSDYKLCEGGLLPANFSQLERSRVQYKQNAMALSASAEVLLDNIALYLQTDKTVLQVFVDGHADNVGKRKDNLTVSEERAQRVSDYLIEQGVSEEMIVMRYHGEVYPVTSNKTKKGRSINRRTTIRLSRTFVEPETEAASASKKQDVEADLTAS